MPYEVDKTNPVRLHEGRYQRYVGHGQYVHPGYKSEAHRRRSQLVGELALLAMPFGYGVSLARRAHYGIKGVRRVQAGKFGGRYYDTSRRKFISAAEYRSKIGLPRTTIEAAKFPHRMYKHAVSKAYKRFPRTMKWTRRVEFARDPALFLKKKYIPYYGFAYTVAGGYGLYRRLLRPYEGEGDEDNPRRPRVYNEVIIEGSPLAPGSKSPLSRSRYYRKSNQISGCPSGHRWSRKLRKCVPYRRKRS